MWPISFISKPKCSEKIGEFFGSNFKSKAMGKNWPYTPYMKLRQRAGKKGVMFVRSRVWEVHCKNHSKKWVFFNWNNEITKKNVWAGLICGQHPIPSSSPRLPLKIPGCCWTVFSRLWRENVRFSTGRPLPPNTTTKCERERIFRIRWIETFRAQDVKWQMVRKLTHYRPRRKQFQVARNFHGRSQEFARIELQISERSPRKFKTKDNCQAKLTERC